MGEDVMWCTTCGARFSEEEIRSAKGCPKCGTQGVPCSVEQDYWIEINWHELRILTIWADNWSSQLDKGGQDALKGIIGRLQRQRPDDTPLTMGGELRELRQLPEVSKVETNIAPEGFVVVHGEGAVGHGQHK